MVRTVLEITMSVFTKTKYRWVARMTDVFEPIADVEPCSDEDSLVKMRRVESEYDEAPKQKRSRSSTARLHFIARQAVLIAASFHKEDVQSLEVASHVAFNVWRRHGVKLAADKATDTLVRHCRAHILDFKVLLNKFHPQTENSPHTAFPTS